MSNRRWGGRFERPVVVFTSDQDWAPEWTCEALLDATSSHGVPLHVFRTSPSAVLDRAAVEGRITQGWHPNFQPGSSHGATPHDVVAYCRALVPGARTARSHCFVESTQQWIALAGAGVVADAQVLTAAQSHLEPMVHWTGLLRLPTFFADDTFFTVRPGDLDLGGVLDALRAPGLKVVIFHPATFGCNVPSEAWYRGNHGAIFGSTDPSAAYVGRGTRLVFHELCDAIADAGIEVVGFETLVDDLLATVDAERPVVGLSRRPQPAAPR